tara:strand:- start:376 stop:624 length:249 start_codon:yes stop_codon:yes gene_type:complete
MTKNELINKIQSLKIDLEYLKKELQFRMEGNDIDGTIEQYKDNEYKYAAQSGAFQSMVSMDNNTFKRAISSIEDMETKLNNN